MTDIIIKYFNDPEDYSRENKFLPPAAPGSIRQAEEDLSIKFPQDYIDFLLFTNGYEGKLGQSYSRFIQVEKIKEYTEDYGREFLPWIVFIGTDGGNEMYIIDKRSDKLKFGILPYIGDENDFILLGDTFEEFVRHLYYNDFWGNKNIT